MNQFLGTGIYRVYGWPMTIKQQISIASGFQNTILPPYASMAQESIASFSTPRRGRFHSTRKYGSPPEPPGRNSNKLISQMIVA
uniref:Uncharacterized protein n=1 Tax=Rhizophora mucronata TaxID=61149 RepID=A0A2P2Q6H7_RHIMU